MPRYTSKDGKQVIETSNAREGVTLRAQGFAVSKARTKAVQEADAKKEAQAAATTAEKPTAQVAAKTAEK